MISICRLRRISSISLRNKIDILVTTKYKLRGLSFAIIWYLFRCPEGWIDGLDLGCFFFAPDDTVGLSWSQAQQYCARLQNGAFLAEIDSAQTQEFIETILEELNVEKYSWWLGGTDFFQV